jgi:transcription initiation factor IIE alpha subunit
MKEVIDNQIFHHYRKNQKKIKKAITLLKKNNFIVYEKKQNY